MGRKSWILIVLLVLVLVGISVAYVLTRPAATVPCRDELTVARDIGAFQGRLTLVDAVLAIVTLVSVSLAANLFRAAFWPAVPWKRHAYPAFVLAVLGVLVLAILAIAPWWAPAASLTGADPASFRCSAFADQALRTNILALGLLGIPLLTAAILFAAHVVASLFISPAARASRA